MRIFFLSILSIFFLIVFSLIYLSIFGYETEKFNSLLESKISSNEPNARIDLSKIKIKVDLKKLGFFITTSKPKIKYYETNLNVKKIKANINFKSFLTGSTEIDKIYISFEETDIQEVKKIIKYFKPSNFKKFFLNEVQTGSISFNVDLYLKNNEISNYEVNGYVKDLFAVFKNIKINNSSFIYSIKENYGEIDNLRGLISGFQINSGFIKFDNSNSLSLNGEIKSNLNLTKKEIGNFFDKKILENFNTVKINGSLTNLFNLEFDKTLKLINYKIKASGVIKNSNLNFKDIIKINLLRNGIENLNFEKTEFKIDYNNDENKNIYLSGLYKLNNKQSQKFELKNVLSKLQKISINLDFNDEISIPILNFNSKNKIVNFNTDLEIGEKLINLKTFSLKENKSFIKINKMLIKNRKLKNFDKIIVKTFKDNKINNDFSVLLNDKLEIKGSKYDASNLTSFLDKRDNSKFLNDVNKEISVNINEISNNFSEKISNFSLIGSIKRGKFNKIISKGKFYEDKYIDISLREDEISKMKILEVYSDLPGPLLNNYNFFKGLSGGKLLFNSYYNSQKSNSNLIVENFKVKDAPNIVKLLSLADFGGMADAISGEGLSFEKLEMKIEKNNNILNLRELYAIGPSISVLMEGYVESKTDLVSLRGTMVPAKTLNKFLSKVPIVGDILIPKEIGEGLFGISFKMKGTPGNIKTTVNPIKSLTPRFIQKALKKTK